MYLFYTDARECTGKMATIFQSSDGSWRLQIRRKGKYASQNFRLKGQARVWVRKIEHVIDEGGEDKSLLSSQVRQFSHVFDLHIVDLQEVGKTI